MGLHGCLSQSLNLGIHALQLLAALLQSLKIEMLLERSACHMGNVLESHGPQHLTTVPTAHNHKNVACAHFAYDAHYFFRAPCLSVVVMSLSGAEIARSAQSIPSRFELHHAKCVHIMRTLPLFRRNVLELRWKLVIRNEGVYNVA